MATKIIREHDVFPTELHPNYWAGNFIEYEGLLLNPKAASFDQRYFIKWDKLNEGWQYYASYIVGAQWIDADNQKALAILPKEDFKDVDFFKMFSVCLNAGIESERFSKIYGIDINVPRIPVSKLDGMLSPLLIVHFISVVRSLIKIGLKHDYLEVENNLRKIKGRLLLMKNERINVIPKRGDRVYCRYQEHTADIPENRLIKKALLFSRRVLSLMRPNSSMENVNHILSKCLDAFQGVSEDISVAEVKYIRYNKLYKWYKDACEIAKMILMKYDYSMDRVSETQTTVPAFWIDMPLLFELYVLGLLKSKYNNHVIYQFVGDMKEQPDFLLVTDNEKLILDTKYMYSVEGKIDIIRQLSGYARSEMILDALGTKKGNDCHSEIIPCVFIYPMVDGDIATNPFNASDSLLSSNNCSRVDGYREFYKYSIPLPQK